jgi:hypothetical protein
LLNATITGDAEAAAYLNRVAGKLRNGEKGMKTLGLALLAHFQKNMTKGIDPNGNDLPPPARWTRIAGRGAGTGKGRMTGKMIPLLNTGKLRGSMQVFGVKKDSVTIGWKGKMLDIAGNMTNGTAGLMVLRGKSKKGFYSGIRNGKNGEYIRVNNDGQWITRKVTSGSVLVHPLARPFFFVTEKQAKMAEKAMNIHVDKVLAS